MIMCYSGFDHVKNFSVFTPDLVPYPEGSLIPGLGNGAESKEAV
jgi:hypothetical protein